MLLSDMSTHPWSTIEGARRLSDRENDEAGWLAERRTMVTASESAHLLGLLKGKDWALLPDELAERKLSGERIEVGPLAHAGAWWETRNLEWMVELTGLPFLPLSSLYRSEDHPALGATPDGIYRPLSIPETNGFTPNPSLLPFLRVYDEFDEYEGAEAYEHLRRAVSASRGPVILELKHQRSRSRSRWNKPWKAPPEYVNQVRHQCVVCRGGLGLLAAKVDANELYVHIVERDAQIEELLVDACEEFYEKYLRRA